MRRLSLLIDRAPRSPRVRRLFALMAVALAAILCQSAARADDDGFKPIFDGQSLNGWDGNPDFWRVADGAITGQTTKEKPAPGNTFCIWRQGETDDFELKCEYRIFSPWGNSGIQYRSFEVPNEKWVVGGYQADIETGDTYSGILYAERDRGILAQRGEKTVVGNDHKPQKVGEVGNSQELQTKIKKDDWNEYHVIVSGNHMIHKINGNVTVDVTDNDETGRRRSGILALQLHAGEPMKVQFRNIRLKRLPLEDKKKIVLVGGNPSHGYGQHAFTAGVLLLRQELNDNAPGVLAVAYTNGWPKDPTAFDNANAVAIYCDGGEGHPINQHLEEVDKLMKKGVGLACMHYGVEVPKGKSGDAFLDWIGGYFEAYWSVNPTWELKQTQLPQGHAITRGVKPFEIVDEWYFHMRFRPNMERVTPILSALPPDNLFEGPDGTHSGNAGVRADKGKPQHLAWATERPDGGRGFGFTGGHFHVNWGNDNFRKLILNSLVWIAKAEVPGEGVNSKTPTLEELEANQATPPPADFNREQWRQALEKWKQK